MSIGSSSSAPNPQDDMAQAECCPLRRDDFSSQLVRDIRNLRFLLSWLPNPGDREDIAHTTLAALLRQFCEKHGPPCKFCDPTFGHLPYAGRIARRTLAQEIESRRRQGEIRGDIQLQRRNPPSEEPMSMLSDKEAKASLKGAIGSLEPELRQVAYLRIHCGLTQEETAAVLWADLPSSAAGGARVRRRMKEFRRHLMGKTK